MTSACNEVGREHFGTGLKLGDPRIQENFPSKIGPDRSNG